MNYKYYETILEQLAKVNEYEKNNILNAAILFANTIEKGGLIHVFGSGHSHTLSIELVHRAGGLVPIKAMDESGRGLYEEVEGVGTRFMENYDLLPEDTVLITSNSSRNPISYEIAKYAKEQGVPVVTCYAESFAKDAIPRHSSGKKVYEISDLVINNHCVKGDATIDMEGMDTLCGPTSTIVTAYIYNQIVLDTIRILLERGIEPPVLKSKNIDGGAEFNEKLLQKYKYRLYFKRYLKN